MYKQIQKNVFYTKQPNTKYPEYVTWTLEYGKGTKFIVYVQHQIDVFIGRLYTTYLTKYPVLSHNAIFYQFTQYIYYFWFVFWTFCSVGGISVSMSQTLDTVVPR